MLSRSRNLRRARDGAEAVQKTRELHPDLVILDLNMPGSGGLSAASRLQNYGSGAQILVFTTHSFPGIERVLRSAECKGLVSELHAERDLLRGIREVLAGREFYNSAPRRPPPPNFFALSSGRREPIVCIFRNAGLQPAGFPSSRGHPERVQRVEGSAFALLVAAKLGRRLPASSIQLLECVPPSFAPFCNQGGRFPGVDFPPAISPFCFMRSFRPRL